MEFFHDRSNVLHERRGVLQVLLGRAIESQKRVNHFTVIQSHFELLTGRELLALHQGARNLLGIPNESLLNFLANEEDLQTTIGVTLNLSPIHDVASSNESNVLTGAEAQVNVEEASRCRHDCNPVNGHEVFVASRNGLSLSQRRIDLRATLIENFLVDTFEELSEDLSQKLLLKRTRHRIIDAKLLLLRFVHDDRSRRIDHHEDFGGLILCASKRRNRQSRNIFEVRRDDHHPHLFVGIRGHVELSFFPVRESLDREVPLTGGSHGR